MKCDPTDEAHKPCDSVVCLRCVDKSKPIKTAGVSETARLVKGPVSKPGTWVSSLGHTSQKKKTPSPELSFDLDMWAEAYPQ